MADRGRRFVPQLPEPGRFWVRYAPRRWEGPEQAWLDLAACRLGRSGHPPRGGTQPPRLALPALPAAVPEAATAPPFDDVVYLPPVPAHLAAERDALAQRALVCGAPVLVQLSPGDETALPDGGGAIFVFDLLRPLLAGDADLFDTLARVPPWAAAAAWPLLPGVTDDPDLWERACQRLAAAGLGCVQAMVPQLAPGDRRRLAEGLGEPAFEALFHRPPPAERDFARVAHRHGIAPFLPRPLPRPPLLGAENRRIAGLLATAAELWLRLGRPVEQAQSLFRAARWLDATRHDAAALRRDGNLAVVTVLDSLARRAVIESIDDGEPALLAELLGDYLESPVEPISQPSGQKAESTRHHLPPATGRSAAIDLEPDADDAATRRPER